MDVALRHVDIGIHDPPVLSSDGQLVAFSVFDRPPKSSLTSRLGTQEVDLLPSGMLSRFDGARLLISEIASGEMTEIHPGDWSNWNVVISPDSRRVAFYSDAGGTPQLWVANVDGSGVRRVLEERIFVKSWSVRDPPVWTRDGSGLFVLVVQEVVEEDRETEARGIRVSASGSEYDHLFGRSWQEWPRPLRPGTVSRAEIRLVDVESGRQRLIARSETDLQPYAFAVSPSQEWVAFVSLRAHYDPSAFELNLVGVDSGESRSLGQIDRVNLGTDNYNTGWHWSPTEERLLFVRDSLVHVLDLTGEPEEAPRVLAAEMGRISAPGAQDRPRVDMPAFTRDGRMVVARLPGTPIAFVVAGLDGSPARRIQVDLPIAFQGLVFGNGNVLWQPNEHTFLFQGRLPGSLELSLLEVDLETGDTRVLFQEDAALQFFHSVDPQTILVQYTNAETAPDLFMLNADLTVRRRVTHLTPALDDLELGPVRVLSTRVPAYDGSMRTATTTILLPPDFRPGSPAPAIIQVYPDQDMSTRARQFAGGRVAGVLAPFWTSRGYAVVYTDLTGITPRLHEGNLVREITDALLPQVYHAVDAGYLDPDRLVLSGHSFGGFATTAVITQTSLFRAAVTYASAPLDLLSSSNSLFVQGWAQTVARLGPQATPWNSLRRYLANSPWHQADLITTPLFMAHGLLDNIDPGSSVGMHEALTVLGRPSQLVLYEGEPHIMTQWSRANAVDLAERVLEFVSRHAPPS